ncbi:MAG: FMN-binding negative transcriptional regulator [Rhodobacteraceae bacterium]|nr:FMN-binding negative transcriptional regulator [Paracoccaceae bacterium]
MYLPAHFTEEDQTEIATLMDGFPFAVLVATGADGLFANHVPVLRDREDSLIGHVALANSMHRQIEDGGDILTIFSGEDSYISPNWYPSKKQNHSHVPTWNYQAVHVYGRIFFQHDDKTKLKVVGRLTKRFEAETNGPNAWRMADAPKDYMDKLLAHIVAFRIDIDRIEAKSKLSQNRDPGDFGNVARELEAREKTKLSGRMDHISATLQGDS